VINEVFFIGVFYGGQKTETKNGCKRIPDILKFRVKIYKIVILLTGLCVVWFNFISLAIHWVLAAI
jgi:hypothetical protein